MALIYLIRHAETQAIPGRPSAEWPLSSRGELQAEMLAQLDFWRQVGAVYSSPESKALATVEPAAKRHSLPVTTLEGLRELARPAGDILTQSEYSRTVAACFGAPSTSVRGWEPAGLAQRRIVHSIRQVAAELESDASGTAAAVVSHGLVLSLFMASLDHRPAPTVAEWRSLPMPGWAVLDCRNWRLQRQFRAVQ